MTNPRFNAKLKESLNLKRYHTFGLSMLQLMLLLGSMGLIAAAIYEWLH